MELLKDNFNAGVKYKGKTMKWDIIILNKAQELARFLLGKSGFIDFMEPAPCLVRSNSRELHERVLGLSASEARRLGLGKSTIHYLKKCACDRKPFKIYDKVRSKLQSFSAFRRS